MAELALPAPWRCTRNLVLLCWRHHHDSAHHPAWHLKLLPDATVEVTTPAGRMLTSRAPPVTRHRIASIHHRGDVFSLTLMTAIAPRPLQLARSAAGVRPTVGVVVGRWSAMRAGVDKAFRFVTNARRASAKPCRSSKMSRLISASSWIR